MSATLVCINCFVPDRVNRPARPNHYIAGGTIGPFCDVCWKVLIEDTTVVHLAPGRSSRGDAFQAVNNERVYQDLRWSRPEHNHEVEAYLVYIRHYLRKAEDLTSTIDCSHVLNREKVMDVMRKIAALAVAAMEEHGVVYREPR